LPTIKFFNELYGYLLEKTQTYNSAKFDEYLEQLGFKKTIHGQKKKMEKQQGHSSVQVLPTSDIQSIILKTGKMPHTLQKILKIPFTKC